MSSLFFWKEWIREYRYIWYTAAALFFFSLFYLWYAYFTGIDAVTHWDKLQEQQIININVHTFRLGPFQINVPAESYVVMEHFRGSALSPNTTASYISLAILALAFTIMIAVVSTFEKFWYFFGISLLIVLLISLRFEVLGLFGVYKLAVPAVIILLYAGPSLYFNSFRPATSFLVRLVTFLAITIALATIIWFFSREAFPFFHLCLTSLPANLIIALLFIILVGHDIVAGFVYAVGQGSSRSLQHLLLISTIYLVNVFIAALHELDVIKWDFVYVNAYLLLSISALIAIWGYRSRETLYGNIMPFYPFGALLFLAVGAVCFSATAQLLANFNDPGLKIIREIILFVHAGYGLMFLLYLISNYGDLLAKDRSPYKVLYTPLRMPYFSYRLAGLIATLAFVVYGNLRDYLSHGMAAFYNVAGDLHSMMDNRSYAESFYLLSSKQGFENYRAAYVLANMKSSRLNISEAHYYYKLAVQKSGTDYAMVNAGNMYMWSNDYTEATKKFREGLTKLPGSAFLANNAGIVYSKRHLPDSAAYYFNLARSKDLTRNTAEMNFFALAASEGIPLKMDSLLKAFETTSPGTISNALAAATAQRIPFEYEIDPLANEKLNLETATLLNNYVLHNAREVDTVFLNKAFAIASAPENASYSEALKAALAFGYYHQGNISRAMEIMAEQVFLSQSYQGNFNYIMGLWALEQDNPDKASTFFTYADTQDFREARFYNAIALTEAGRRGAALAAWDSVARTGSEAHQIIAASIRKILTQPESETTLLGDAEKYQFCRYRISFSDTTLFNRISDTFRDSNYKALALLDMSRKLFEAGYTVPAIRQYQRIAGLRLTDKQLYDNIRHFELRMLASRGEVRELAKQINDGIEFGPGHNLEKIWYAALIAEANGDTVTAETNYKILARYNPYFEEGVLAAYRYYRNKTGDGLYPYTILAEAIQVNDNSLRLLRAYHEEASRVGLTEYAEGVAERIHDLEQGR